MDESLYDGREQSQVKHLILERYLLDFAMIIGQWNRSITYVDCFAGPWKSQSEKHQDTSFAIAIKKLREARNALADIGKSVDLRAVFVEKHRESFRQLDQYISKINDIDVKLINSDFESSVAGIVEFIGAKSTFPFVFIDPTGWTGFALEKIRPILELKPCEVLINFMTKDIIRFIEHEQSGNSFEQLFGDSSFRDELAGLRGEERVDAAVFKYRDVVSTAGKYDHASVATILSPMQRRAHFHLIFLTRNWKGLDVFKKAEKKSMEQMEKIRAEVETKYKQQKGPLLPFTDDPPESQYYRQLRNRYIQLAKDHVFSLITQRKEVSYDEVCNAWCRFPMVWESDLKDWIDTNEAISVEGLGPRGRRPQRGKNHILIYEI